MGKEARVALLLAASACLLAVMVDWAVVELNQHEDVREESQPGQSADSAADAPAPAAEPDQVHQDDPEVSQGLQG